MEVAGRWFGVRGRRFVRPALTIRQAADADQVRALADLEHKPWAAEDGDVWLAAFSVEADLDDAAEIELSVAPDITVALRRPDSRPARAGDLLTATQPGRSPVAKAASTQTGQSPAAKTPSKHQRRRPARTGAQELERLNARLADATQELGLERERRAATDRTLEEERAASRRLRTELGQVQAELELLRAAQAEAAAPAAELETARRDLTSAQRRHEELVRERDRELSEARRRQEDLARERDQTTQAHAASRTELHERLGALESAREALEQERAETGRLRDRLARAEHPGPDASPRPATSSRHSDAPAPSAAGSRPGDAAPRSAARSRPGAEPTRDAPRSARGGGGDDAMEAQLAELAALATGSRRSGRPATDSSSARTAPAAARPARPLNPSLRHTYWLGRALALLVLLVVIAAIWSVLHSTILH